MASAVNSVVQAVVAHYLLKRVDRALSVADNLVAQVRQLVKVPGSGEHGRVPEAPGDQAESPGPGSAL